MTTLLDCDWPTLEGRQDPEHLLCDEGDQSEADRALVFGDRIGRKELPWQESTTRAILTLEPDALFTHPTCAVIAPRQNGKTLSAAERRIIFGLFLRGERIIYSAHRWATAESIFKRIKRAIESRPSLKRRVVRWTCSQGQASIELSSGALASFVTRSLDSGRGFDEIDVIVYDESYNLKDAETAALSPTQLAARNPQTIYLSSAVNENNHANGLVLAGIRARALESIKWSKTGTGLYFAEYMAPAPPEDIAPDERRRIREDPATWKVANPSYGVIQNEAKVRKLLTELSETDFEVEVLGWGRWPTVGARQSLIPSWSEFADESPVLSSPYPRVIGVDRSPASKVWSIAGMQYRSDGHAYGEIGFSRQASPTEVVEYIVDLVTEADPSALVIDQRSPAAILKPYLEQVGIDPVMTNASDLAMACEGVLEAAKAGQVSHSGQKILSDSVKSAVKRDLPGGRYAWDGPGIVQFVAFTLAHWGLLTFATPPKKAPPPMADTDAPEGRGAAEHDFDPMTAPF